MKTNIITLIALIIIITGCGGGGDSSTSPEKTVATAPSTQVVIEEVIEEVTTTSELNSTPEFNFISNTDLNVTLPATPSTNITYFINICTAFSTQNNEVKINYDSCKLRASLTTTEQPFILSISATELMLVAQIWPIKEGAQPITQFWNIDESGNSWKITI